MVTFNICSVVNEKIQDTVDAFTFPLQKVIEIIPKHIKKTVFGDADYNLNIGQLKLIPPDTVSKCDFGVYNRGSPKAIQFRCAPGYEYTQGGCYPPCNGHRIGITCYDYCDDNYHFVLGVCWFQGRWTYGKTCAGAKTECSCKSNEFYCLGCCGLHCDTWWDSGGSCDSGYTNTGCTCQANKTSYNDHGRIDNPFKVDAGCFDSEYPDPDITKVLCYKKCDEGYKGAEFLCFKTPS